MTTIAAVVVVVETLDVDMGTDAVVVVVDVEPVAHQTGRQMTALRLRNGQP